MNYSKKTVYDVDVKGKKVLLRCDFNVPQDKKTGEITSDKRIVAALPTIRYLLDNGAAVIACSHLGKPVATFEGYVKKQVEKGKNEADITREEWEKSLAKLTLAPVAKRLGELLGQDVIFAADTIGPDAQAKAAALQPGQILLLENLRFAKGETKNDPAFAKALADMAEIFVSDAFGTVHRAHASTAGVAAYLPAYSGLLVDKELSVMGKALDDPKRPFVAVLGGAKVSDKINVINNLLEKADTIIIGGGMAYTFKKAQGFEVGKSLLEADRLDYAKSCCLSTTCALPSSPPTPSPSSLRATSPPTSWAWTSAPRPSSCFPKPCTARAPSCGTDRWAFSSLTSLPPAPRPWPKLWPSPAPSPSSAAATARRLLKSSALPTRSPTFPPAAAPPSSSWKARSCRAWPACWTHKIFAIFTQLSASGYTPSGAARHLPRWGRLYGKDDLI